MAEEVTQEPASPSGDADRSIYVVLSKIKGGEECWSCGMTPGTDPKTEMPSVLITGASEDDYNQIEVCEDCAAEIFRFFTLGHLAFLKDKEKHKDWIFEGNPYFPQP